MPRVHNRVNLLVNVALLVAIGTFLTCITRYMIGRYEFTTASLTADGKQVHLKGINFSTSEQNIIVFLDKDCKFCAQDTAFYQRLAQASRTLHVRLIVAFEHDLRDGKQYLAEKQIEPSETVRLRFQALNIQGTPTILLLNREGRMIAKWVGELSGPLEDYIASIVGVDEDSIVNASSPYLALGNQIDPPANDTESLKSGLLSNTVTLIDVDNREEFETKHIVGSVNIPEDELYSRSLNELDVSKRVVLFSRSLELQKVRNAYAMLRSIGFKETGHLKLTLEAAEAAGLQLKAQEDELK